MSVWLLLIKRALLISRISGEGQMPRQNRLEVIPPARSCTLGARQRLRPALRRPGEDPNGRGRSAVACRGQKKKKTPRALANLLASVGPAFKWHRTIVSSPQHTSPQEDSASLRRTAALGPIRLKSKFHRETVTTLFKQTKTTAVLQDANGQRGSRN